MKIKELLTIIRDNTEISITADGSNCEIRCRPNDKFIIALKELEIKEIQPSYAPNIHSIVIVLKETSNEQQPFTEQVCIR